MYDYVNIFLQKWLFQLRMLYFLFRQIIKKNRKETRNDQEVQRRKKDGGNQCTQRRHNHCSNYNTNRSWTNNDKSMAERCRMARLKSSKSRVQFSDNPVTIVQQQKNWFFAVFSKIVDHCILIRIFHTASCLEIKKRNFSRTKGRVWNSVYTAASLTCENISVFAFLCSREKFSAQIKRPPFRNNCKLPRKKI